MKGIIIFSVIALVLGIIIGAVVFPQTKIVNNPQTETKYICSNGQTVSSTSECPIPSTTDQLSNTIMFQLSADFLGGDKFHPSATGWLDSRYCMDAIKSKGYSDYQYCYIQTVQLLFGSDPNPFKSKNAGYNGSDMILFGGEVFKVSCICSDKPQFQTDSSHSNNNLGLL